MSDTCTWSQEDHESEVYHSSCRKSFMFNDGGPVQNGLKFCCYCGKPLIEDQWKEEEEDE